MTRPNLRDPDVCDAIRAERRDEARQYRSFDDYNDPEGAPSKSTLTEEEINEPVRLHRNREVVSW